MGISCRICPGMKRNGIRKSPVQTAQTATGLHCQIRINNPRIAKPPMAFSQIGLVCGANKSQWAFVIRRPVNHRSVCRIWPSRGSASSFDRESAVSQVLARVGVVSMTSSTTGTNKTSSGPNSRKVLRHPRPAQIDQQRQKGQSISAAIWPRRLAAARA